MVKLAQALPLAWLACSNAASPAPDAGRPDAIVPTSDARVDGPVAAQLVLNEVAAAGDPEDWIEVVNVGAVALELSAFGLTDLRDDPASAVGLPAMTLGPGQRAVVEVSDVTLGFKLGSDEEVWLHELASGALVDGTDWPEGGSPVGGSWARLPDRVGAFTTATVATPGQAND